MSFILKQEIFQLLYKNFSFRRKKSSQSENEFELSFAVSKDSYLLIPQLSKNQKIVDFSVNQLPIPLVSLKADDDLSKPWSDHKPLRLMVAVEAKNFVRSVYVWVEVDKRTSKEVVKTIRDGKKLDYLSTNYELILEPYINKDISEVSVWIEAVDQSHPNPLRGQSVPLNFKVISAYGRYQISLQKLRQVKTKLEELIEYSKYKVDKETLKLSRDASKSAEDTPFLIVLIVIILSLLIGRFKFLVKSFLLKN